jgi:hypothetical protein
MRKALSIGVVVTLSACGGGGGDPVDDIVPVVTATLTGGVDLGDLQYNITADTFEVERDGTVYTFQNPEDIAPSFQSYLTDDETVQVITAVSDTSVASLVFFNNTEETAYVLQRLGNTVGPDFNNPPPGGTITYTGDYAGIFTPVSGPNSQLVTGDVMLVIDVFGDPIVSGTISERQTDPTVTTLIEFADVTFEAFWNFDTGQTLFGSVAGGEIVGGDAAIPPGDGTFSGMVTGPDSEEFVGGIELDHFTTDTEVGVFIARQ